MSFISEFKEFATKGSLMDMAVGIIIGAAVGKMVTALVEKILMPLIGAFMGGVNFEEETVSIAGTELGWGSFLQSVIDFIIVSFVIFLIIKLVNSAKRKQEEAPEEPPADIQLLTEIRDLLKK